MDAVRTTSGAGHADRRITERLEQLVKDRTALGEAFRAYVDGTLTSNDCSTLVDGLLRQVADDARLGSREAMLLDMVTDAVAQLANRETQR